MIYITQLIYIIQGKENIFHQFEDIAIPLIEKYNGRLLLRIRPDKNAIVTADIEVPYEIHFVSFDTENDFENFKQDETRKIFLHLKNDSIRSSLLIKGEEI